MPTNKLNSALPLGENALYLYINKQLTKGMIMKSDYDAEIYDGITREKIIEYLVDYYWDAIEQGGLSFHELMVRGFNGYENYSDAELIEEYQFIVN